MKLRITLRARLVMLVLAAIVPLLGLSVFRAWLNADAAIELALTDLRLAVSLAALSQQRGTETVRQVLTVITNAPVIREGKPDPCNRYLGELGRLIPSYANLGIVGTDGYSSCHGHGSGNGAATYLGDRAYFRDAVSRRSFVAGQYIVGRFTGKPAIPFALPVLDARGRVSFVAYAALDLTEMARSIAAIEVPPGVSLGIHDRSGTLLAGTPNVPLRIGQKAASPVLLEAVRTMGTGVREGLDGAGRQRLWAFMPSSPQPEAAFIVAASMDRSLVVGPSLRQLELEIAVLALLAFLGGWLAWGMAGRAIVRPTTKILAVTSQLQQGRLDARISLNPHDSSGEFSEIATGINRMADSLQAQREAQKAELASSRMARQRLRDAQRLGRIGYWQYDLSTQWVWWSDEVYDLLGLEPGQLDSSYQALLQRIHPDDRAAFDAARDAAVQSGTALDQEFRIITAAGAVRWIHLIGRVHGPDEGGPPTHRSGVIQDITERHEAQAQRRLLETCIAHLNDIVIITEGEPVRGVGRRTVFVNDAFERITGYRREEVLGQSLLFLNGPDTDRAVLDRIRVERNKRQRVWAELINYTRGGKPFWVEFDSMPVADSTGKLTHWVTVGRDRTERKQAEQALRDSEQRYAALFEAAPVPMWVFDVATHQFLAVNRAAIKSYGYSAEEFRSMTIFDIHPESEFGHLRQTLAEQVRWRKGAWQHRRKDGSVFPAEVFSKSVQHAGRAARFVVALDISEQVKAEKDVAEHLSTLQRAADAAQAITWHQTLKGALQEVADQARGVIGAHQAVVNLHKGNDAWAWDSNTRSLSDKYACYRDLQHGLDGSGIYALVCETNRSMRLTQAELEAHPRWRGFGSYAGRHPPMRGWLAVPLVGHDGRNIGLLQLSDKFEGEFTQQDEYVALELAQLASAALENARLIEEVGQLNTGLEQKVAERTAALTRQEAKFRALSDQAPQVIWTADSRGAVKYLNRAWLDLVGGKAEDWLGGKWYGAVHPEDLPVVNENWRVASSDLSLFSGTRRVRARDGSYHTMAYRGSPVLDEQGKVLFWVGIDADITEVKAVEAALRLANQELQSFSYSVSHDLRSPLNTISGFSQLLAKQLDVSGNDKLRHYLSRIQAGTAQMGQLIADLLALSQVLRVTLHHEVVDLSAMARSITDDLQAQPGKRQVALRIDSGLQAQADAGLLRVVLENLLGNAWKFSAQQAQAEISVGQTLDAAGEPVFFVRDNGVGFDMAYADKLFTPFQRLHAVTEFAGTGIGLATVRRVIERHGGRLWADAAPGRGATFFFTLPRRTLP